MDKLTGKLAVITGGATEINAAIAKSFIAEGAKKVYILDENAEAAKAALEGTGAVAAQCDIGVFADVTRCFDEIKAADGEVDILINNPQASSEKTAMEISYEEWKRDIAINVDSMFFCCKQVVASMKERKTGEIINVSSPDYMGVAGKISYVTSKAAVHGFTGTVCREMERYGVTANVLTPDHNATPEEIAGIVTYLCSEDGRSAHGVNMTVAHSFLED